MDTIDVNAFTCALGMVNDGFVFEDFAKRFLSAILGYDFIPVGASKDKGIDGFEHYFERKENSKKIYQMSTEQDYSLKIDNSIEKLRTNGINFDYFCYVTNRIVNNKERLIDDLYDTYKKQFQIYDQRWFSTNCNYNPAAIQAYEVFLKSIVHEFSKPDKTYVVSDLVNDPRLFVFLRQQFENKDETKKLDELLADSLILYGLEGTDPDKNILKTATEIKESISKYIKFNPKILYDIIDQRLKVLSTKPRKIKHHNRQDAYCLPFETRREIIERDLNDRALQNSFYISTEERIKKYLKSPGIIVKDVTKLVDETIHKIFYLQGLEFANFVIQGEQKDIVERELPDIIGNVVDESTVVSRNKEGVKTALLLAIRDIIYNGLVEQKEYLRKLSNTYLMVFMLHWDPKIATYFESLAGKLEIFVCTSIIIPALSEYYLEPINKRYWNLLKYANSAGIKLVVNETMIEELATHFKKIMNNYNKYFRDTEAEYLKNEYDMMYVDDILIRAYFYSKRRKQVHSFEEFIDNFANPNLRTVKDELISYLKSEFGIKYYSNEYLNVKLDETDKNLLFDKLKDHKDHEIKAKNDAALILTIYKLRERNNESESASLFGYKTWWLSLDTKTYRVITALFKDKYPVSCYMRPDFLYNYIQLSPRKAEVDDMFREIFPSLIGVNLSFHLPKSITTFIQSKIIEHTHKNPARVSSLIRQLSDKLKSEPNLRNMKYIKEFWTKEEQKSEPPKAVSVITNKT